MKAERYIDNNNNPWVRIKFLDKYRTEVVLPEPEFEKKYGKVGQHVA